MDRSFSSLAPITKLYSWVKYLVQASRALQLTFAFRHDYRKVAMKEWIAPQPTTSQTWPAFLRTAACWLGWLFGATSSAVYSPAFVVWSESDLNVERNDLETDWWRANFDGRCFQKIADDYSNSNSISCLFLSLARWMDSFPFNQKKSWTDSNTSPTYPSKTSFQMLLTDLPWYSMRSCWLGLCLPFASSDWQRILQLAEWFGHEHVYSFVLSFPSYNGWPFSSSCHIRCFLWYGSIFCLSETAGALAAACPSRWVDVYSMFGHLLA